MTEQKTARELANRIECMNPYTTDMAYVIEQAILSYSSSLQTRLKEAEARLAKQNLVLEGYKLMAGLSDPDPVKVQGMIETRMREVEGERDRCKNSVPGSLKSYIAREEHLSKEVATLESTNQQLKAENEVLKKRLVVEDGS